MAVAVDPISELQRQVEATLANSALDPSDKLVKLRGLRARIADLLGATDHALGRVQALRESEASAQARIVLWARSNADLREEMLADGDVTEAELDAAGMLSHAELDRLYEEGLLLEAVTGLVKQWDQAKHARGRAGKFSDMFEPRASAGAAPGPIDERYQRYFRHDPDAHVIHASRLKPTRQDPPEHLAKARENLDRASKGLMAKRKPLDGVENGDGTVSIIDGNSTFAELSNQGLTHFPVKLRDPDTEDRSADQLARERVAGEMADKAQETEPAVTKALTGVVEAMGGQLEGLEHRLKTRESLTRKIESKQEKYPGMSANTAGGRILDALRYTAVFDDANYADGISKVTGALGQAGLTPYMQKNYWGGDDDYDGYHTVFRGQNGEFVELQFHTPESLKVKEELNHPLYEQYRVSKDSHQRWELWQTMVENAHSVTIPAGMKQMGNEIQHPTPQAP